MTMTRRTMLELGATASALPLVHIRTAGAAGTLSVGFWDHWVPGVNEVIRRMVSKWAAQTKTHVTIDFITSVGNKNLLTLAAEDQAQTGHDIQAFPVWEVQDHAAKLESMDDVVQRLTAKYGKLGPVVDYLAKVNGSYKAMPAISGSQNKPCCTRIDLSNNMSG